MRAFLAVPADPAWVENVAERTARLRASLPSASWTRRDAWHLTLRFFGAISESAAEQFANEIARAVESASEGELRPSGGAVFPPRGRARVLTLGFAPSPARDTLESLARAAEAAARRVGSPPEERAFHPHLTLARIRHSWPPDAVRRFLEAVGAWELPPWKLSRCVLFESRLGPGGAVHTPLRSFAFAGHPEVVR